MLKTAVIVLVVIFVCSRAQGQSQGDTLFTVVYDPSFHNPSQLTFFKENNSTKGLFRTISLRDGKLSIDSTISAVSPDTYDSYIKFFSAYKFPGYINNEFPDTSKNYKQGMDGITVSGIYYSSQRQLFRFWSPYDDKESMTLFKMTLNDLDTFFKTRNNKKYLKWLRKYSK